MGNKSTGLFSKALLTVFLCTGFHAYGQIAQSINGMVVSDFKTTQGEVKVILPDDIRPGDVISGTVSVTPEGKTEKDQQHNMEKLQELALQFPGLAMTLHDLLKENKSNQFSFTVPSTMNTKGGNTAELDLMNNDKNIGASTIPVTVASLINPFSPKPLINLQNPLIEKGEPFAVFRSPNADLNKYDFKVQDPTGQPLRMKPVCGSPREMIVELPSNVLIGPGTITANLRESANAPIESVRFHYDKVATEYKIQKNNLQKGETTILEGTIRGIDVKQMHTPTLELNNLTSSTITLEGGNSQVIPVAASANGEFRFERLITGITPGPFNITAVLNVNPKDMTDPFQAQLRCLQTADEYNEWLSALKYDLANYAQSQPNDKTGNANRQNAMTINQNLQPCNGGELETCKTNASNLLHSLVTDPQNVATWDCTYISEQAALDPLKDQLMNKSTRPVDYEMLKEFSDNIQKRAEMAGYNKKLGPMISPLLLQLAISRVYPAGTAKSRELQNDLYYAIQDAANALPDNYLPKYKRPDPKKDFVGYLDPAKNTLWAVQQEVPGILSRIGAVKGANGLYTFTGMNLWGEAVPCSFKIVPSSVVQINLLFKPLADILINGAAAGANQKKDSTDKKKDSTDKPFIKAYMIKQDTDRTSGTIYRFYKNAECVKYKIPFEETYNTNECSPETARKFKHKPSNMSNDAFMDSIQKLIKAGKEFKDDPYETEDYETGRYIKYRILKEIYKCAKGTETCTETLTVWMVKEIYDDSKCTQLLESKPYFPTTSSNKVFSCK